MSLLSKLGHRQTIRQTDQTKKSWMWSETFNSGGDRWHAKTKGTQSNGIDKIPWANILGETDERKLPLLANHYFHDIHFGGAPFWNTRVQACLWSIIWSKRRKVQCSHRSFLCEAIGWSYPDSSFSSVN